IALPLMIACSPSKENKMDYSQINFSMDTVLVDSKEEILFLQYNVSLSDFSNDKRFLYNFSLHDHSIEKIDLDKLEFVERLPFQKDGPNGVGEYVGVFQMVDDEMFYISSFFERGIYNLSGEKLNNLKFDDIELSPSIPKDYYFSSTNIFIPQSQDEVLGIVENWESRTFQMGIVKVKDKYWEGLPIPEFDFLKDFHISLMGERGPMAITGWWLSLNQVNHKMILSNNVGADFYIFDYHDRELAHISFDHQLFPKRKMGSYPRKVESKEVFDQINREFGEEINFFAPVWDEVNQRYYRFAYQNIWKEVEGEMKNTGAKVFISILDKDFKILKESQVYVLDKRPNYHFVKDGKIWIFENMDDEMAFVRLSIMP
ncbi:DUF4221 family protein, partial [Cecembia sp.]|uniref:DUF4221 family protein n=1 Tax=Cecembia sp. TaxID=1898110 RepID=UPI0025BE4C38